MYETSVCEFHHYYYIISTIIKYTNNCYKENIYMVQQSDSSMLISDGPEHITITSSGTPIENSPFNLTCSANCLHGCTLYWWFFNRTGCNNQTLKFNRLSKTENGEYICYIKDYFGTTSKSYSLNVQSK